MTTLNWQHFLLGLAYLFYIIWGIVIILLLHLEYLILFKDTLVLLAFDPVCILQNQQI